MEACGMDVFATVRNTGLEIHTLHVKGEPQNHLNGINVEILLNQHSDTISQLAHVVL